jgi:hypothetical protein
MRADSLAGLDGPGHDGSVVGGMHDRADGLAIIGLQVIGDLENALS